MTRVTGMRVYVKSVPFGADALDTLILAPAHKIKKHSRTISNRSTLHPSRFVHPTDQRRPAGRAVNSIYYRYRYYPGGKFFGQAYPFLTGIPARFLSTLLRPKLST